MRHAWTFGLLLCSTACHVDLAALGEGADDVGAIADGEDAGTQDLGVETSRADADSAADADVEEIATDADVAIDSGSEIDGEADTDASTDSDADTVVDADASASDGGCGVVNLLANAGFEAPAIAANTKVYSNDPAFLPSWSLYAPAADGTNRFWIENGVLPAVGFSRHVEGAQSICLNGDGAYTVWVEQSFTTVVGRHYRLTFSFTDEKAAGPSECALQIDVVGKTFVLTRAGDTGWRVGTIDFVAVATTTTVRFTDATPASSPFNSPFVDDVSIVDCP